TCPRLAPVRSTTSSPTRSIRYIHPSPASPSASRRTATSRPRSRSAPSRSSHPASFATGPRECTAKSSIAISRQSPGEPTSQRRCAPSAPGAAVKAFTFTQPLIPNAPTMRAMTTGSDASLLGWGFGFARGFVLATLDELLHGIGGLRALLHPVLHAVERQAIARLVLGGLGVVEADALDEAPVAGHPRVGDDDAIEGAVPGTASRHPDDDHAGSFRL